MRVNNLPLKHCEDPLKTAGTPYHYLSIAAAVALLILGGCKEQGRAAQSDVADGGAGGAAPATCVSDEQCDDGLFCNGAEECRRGACHRSDEAPCDDGIECTIDSCDEGTRSCANNAPDIDADGARDAACVDSEGDPLGNDCDDSDPLRYPGAIEICDPEDRDEDCDEQTFGLLDRDHDGYFDSRCCNTQGDGSKLCGQDCDDFKANVSPEATEVCDFLDNDCNGEADEGVSVELYPDLDHDGHGDNHSEPIRSCPGAVGVATVANDCDDSDPEVFEGQFEICDEKDNNCDGQADEVKEQAPWFADVDQDGYGDPGSQPVYSCYRIKGRVLSFNDCDDGDRTINPNATEICDGKDNNCNGAADYRVGLNDLEDDDGDGVADNACGGDDCDDSDPRTALGADEVCDRIDNDCDGEVDEQVVQNIWYVDEDGDGWGLVRGDSFASCDPLPGRVTRYGDCDDSDPDIFPGTAELCDGRDNDCDGAIDEVASASCHLDNAIGTCRNGNCEVLSCLPDFAIDEEQPEMGCSVEVAPGSLDTTVPCTVDATCDDGNICNGAETCSAGYCRNGTPVHCDGRTTINGDVFVSNAADLISVAGIETITGNLTISSAVLTSLIGLESLKTIGGDLIIENNLVLTKLSGSALSNLETVGGTIRLTYNQKLADIDLPSLSSAYALIVEDNPVLSGIVGYGNLVKVGYQINFRQNPALRYVAGFHALQFLGGAHNDTGSAGGCLSEQVGGLRLRDNPLLEDISAFESLELIEGDLCVAELNGAALYLPELSQLGMFASLGSAGGFDFPQLESLGHDFTFLGESAEAVVFSAPQLRSVGNLNFYLSGATVDRFELDSLESALDFSFDASTSEAEIGSWSLPELAEVSSLYVDIAGASLQRVTFPSLESAPGFVYVRAVGEQVERIDLSDLAATSSLQVHVLGSEQAVDLRLHSGVTIDGQSSSGLALCTGTLNQDSSGYQNAACQQAQQIIDRGFFATISEATCGQCVSEQPECPEGCNDGNECTSDACVEGECAFAAVDAGTACSVGVCNTDQVPRCVACIDDELGGVIDTGCSEGAPLCTVGEVAACTGCGTNDQCPNPGECTTSFCAEGTCGVALAEPGTPCSGGVCNEGSCVDCVIDDDCDGGVCDAGSCVGCTLDEHCDGGVCYIGFCVECTDDGDCPEGVCAQQTCQQCVDDGDCPGGVCDANACVGCVDDGDCPGGVCDAQSCVECVDDGDCNAGVCDNHSCVGCVDDNDCPEGVCQDQTCVGCVDDADCPGGACSEQTCVQCTNDNHCDGGVCNNNSCVQCTNDNHCDAGVCYAQTCVGCIDDQDCPGGVCDASECVECVDDGDCQGGVCDAQSCVECVDDGDCDGGVCSGNVCFECTGDNHCDGGACADGVCVACTEDRHCRSGVCSANQCVGCADNGDCDDQVCYIDTCVECIEEGDLGSCDDGVSCTDDFCSGTSCQHFAQDSLCPPPPDACSIYQCSATLDCQIVDISASQQIIGPVTLDGSFEMGDDSSWQVISQQQLIYDFGVENWLDYTQPTDGNWMARLGGASDDQSSLLQRFDLPPGAQTLRLLVDTSFQTELRDDNADKFDIELVDVELQPLLALASYSNQDASEDVSQWNSDGVALEVDVSEFAGMDRVGLHFHSTTDRSFQTDFMIDNVRMSVVVCN